MANFKHPEFHLLHKLQLIQEKHPEIEDIGLLVNETLDIINENAIAIVQQASLYALLGKPGDLSLATKGLSRDNCIKPWLRSSGFPRQQSGENPSALPELDTFIS